MKAQGKTLIQQRAELEAATQARHQEYGALQMEATRLRKELQEKESERKAAVMEDFPLSTPGMSSSSSPITVRGSTAVFKLKPRLYDSQLEVLCSKPSPQQHRFLSTLSKQSRCGWNVEKILASWQSALSVTEVFLL